jgi:hypothetical protein
MNAVAVVCPHCGAKRKDAALGTHGKQLSQAEIRALLVSDEILAASKKTKRTTAKVIVGSLAIDGVCWLTDIGVVGYVVVGVIAAALIARSVLRAQAARRRALPLD